jgi:hypothetical protein
MADPDLVSPLTEQDLVGINDRLRELDRADKLIDQAIRGGIDMKEQKTRAQETRAQLLRLKQSFFPGR